MLTNNDLRSIGNLLDDKLETKLTGMEKRLETKLEEKLETKLKPIKKDIAKIRKDQNTIINYFDREYLDLNKRMRRAEDYLHLPVIQ